MKKQVHKSRARKEKKKLHRKVIGMAPFEGYNDIAEEEVQALKKMTMEDARIQTEALLRAVRWMK